MLIKQQQQNKQSKAEHCDIHEAATAGWESYQFFLFLSKSSVNLEAEVLSEYSMKDTATSGLTGTKHCQMAGFDCGICGT